MVLDSLIRLCSNLRQEDVSGLAIDEIPSTRFSCPCATTATLITGCRFGNVIGRFAIVITHFGIVIGRFGNSPKSDHVRPKQPITFRRNSRSRSTEMTRHDRPKYARYAIFYPLAAAGRGGFFDWCYAG